MTDLDARCLAYVAALRAHARLHARFPRVALLLAPALIAFWKRIEADIVARESARTAIASRVVAGSRLAN